MDYEMPQRPHTVGGVAKDYPRSEFIMKLLHEIEEEAKGPIFKPKPPAKNYMKENSKRLKEIQAQAKMRMAEKQTLQPLKVINKYCEVQPKILNPDPKITYRVAQPPKTAGPFRSRPPLSPCLSSKSERHAVQRYGSLPQLSQADTEQVSEASDSPRSGSESGRSVFGQASKIKSKSEALHRPGQIPNYLTERKRQWEQEKERQIKLQEEASIPAGYTLLADEERVDTLELLKRNQEEILKTLATVPVRNDTTRLRKYKQELEKQLAKVEEGIKIFSRPKVLIKNDS